MFTKLMNYFFGTKKDKIKKQIDKKRFEAIQYQRNGNIREYSRIMTEVQQLEEEYDRL